MLHRVVAFAFLSVSTSAISAQQAQPARAGSALVVVIVLDSATSGRSSTWCPPNSSAPGVTCGVLLLWAK